MVLVSGFFGDMRDWIVRCRNSESIADSENLLITHSILLRPLASQYSSCAIDRPLIVLPREANDNLGLEMFVESLVPFRNLVNTDDTARDAPRLCPATLDKLYKLRRECLGVDDSSLDRQAFGPELSHWKVERGRDLARLRTPRGFVLRNIDADDTDTSAASRYGDGVVDDVVLLRLELFVDAFVAAAVAASVNAVGLQLEDLLRRAAFGEIDWNSSNFLGFGQANRHMVHNVYSRGTSEECGIGAEKTDWTCAEDGDSLAGAKARKIKTGPGCGPDIADHEIVKLP